MSQLLISRSPDLKRLQDEGYALEIYAGYLLLRDVPYVKADRSIGRGVLISKLALSNDRTASPDDHVAYFSGAYPCDHAGRPIDKISNPSPPFQIAEGLEANFTFSAKPQPSGRYDDYYAKMSTYAAIIAGPARMLDPSVTATTFPLVKADTVQSIFQYIDTASSRAEINVVTDKLKLDKVAIVGLGGTGSYVLDLVAKTPVREIHLFDGDLFLQHNAFRSPGAPSGEELDQKLLKTDYFRNIYSKMHRGVVCHPVYVDTENVEALTSMAFVFLCLDRGIVKRLIIQRLEAAGVSFIDVGMGLYLEDEALGGVVRTTTSTPQQRSHVWEKGRIPFAEAHGGNEYGRNIQIADLNAFNAALAVIRWKKLFGFYHDLDHEYYSAYSIDGNTLLNEDKL